MKPALAQTTWCDFPAWTLENERIRVVIVPALGAKIVSLLDKTCQHEWLVPPNRPLKLTGHGADFVSQDMSGWDEMLPTIVACDWDGRHFPDHGEVWSRPWTLESDLQALVFSVNGVALPYRFTRSAVFSASDCLKLYYHLTNTCEAAFPYLWTAHPQFAADLQTRILLPPAVTQMVNVIDGDKSWGKAGELHSWPEATAANGETQRLDRVRPVEARACRKFYLSPEQPVSWAALIHEGLGCELRLEWSSVEIPYLGLWVDEGIYNTAPVAALEPSSGYYDSLERAVANQRVPVLSPGESRDWTITLRFGKNEP